MVHCTIFSISKLVKGDLAKAQCISEWLVSSKSRGCLQHNFTPVWLVQPISRNIRSSNEGWFHQRLDRPDDLHLAISKMDHCTILQKRQFLTTMNTMTKSRVRLHQVIKLVKWITAQFCKKDNFLRRRNTTTKSTKTCAKPVFLSRKDGFRRQKSAFSTLNFLLSTGTSRFLRRNTYRSYAGRLYWGLYVSQK